MSHLSDFAIRVLAILEEDSEWDADTIDRIGLEAINRDLAFTDSDLKFRARRIPEPQPQG